ncbi:helix-turn-helix domain-containing protein [Haloferula sp.]|uniref:helix-turn-helix domain-containing protein n=1 Tax=Haloferula sp. TaxID=2497595 RepID=UPI003C71012E
MKAKRATTKSKSQLPTPADLKTRKDALERGESIPSRVFQMEKKADGSYARIEVNAESQRRKSAREWKAKSKVAQARHTLGMTQGEFAELLGVGISTLRSWEQKKREPSGAARMLIAIAIKHPEVLQDAVA